MQIPTLCQSFLIIFRDIHRVRGNRSSFGCSTAVGGRQWISRSASVGILLLMYKMPFAQRKHLSVTMIS
jgi:hypothetical protein